MTPRLSVRRLMPRQPVQAALVLGLAVTGLAWLPSTLVDDIDGLRSNRYLGPSAAADIRGPTVRAWTNLSLVHAALASIPAGQPFAIIRAGRWGSAKRPNRRRAFVWEASVAWTQFALAPRVEVPPPMAGWILIRDATPAAAGFPHPQRAWRFGRDWLVKVR